MPTKLERINKLEDELYKLKQQVEEEEDKAPEIIVGCIVTSKFGDRLVVRLNNNNNNIGLVPIRNTNNDQNYATRLYIVADQATNQLDNLINYIFLASSLEEYYKQKGGCCGKCSKEE